MAVNFSSSTNGALADVTIGYFGPAYAGNGEGGLSTGIGMNPGNSRVPNPDEVIITEVADMEPQRIGGGTTATAGSNLGSIINGATFVAGSGYTNGTYYIDSTGGGAADKTARVVIVIAGGAITSVAVQEPGAGFSSAPTFTVANAVNVVDGTGPGAGASGTVTVTVGTNGRLNAIGPSFGTNKGVRRVLATGSSAAGAAVPPSTYLNRSGRAMVAGEFTSATAP